MCIQPHSQQLAIAFCRECTAWHGGKELRQYSELI
jgi:hypothetical protein